MTHELVDPDDPRTWPQDVRAWAQSRAAALKGAAEFTCDLRGGLIEREPEFRALFTRTKVLVYHCTRLLDWEAEDIRRNGLRPLTRELVHHRIHQALDRGVLTPPEATRLKRFELFNLGEEKGRQGQVCFVMGRRGLDDTGCQDFFSLWGGEAIYWALADEPDPPRLGRPAIVVARIDVAAERDLFLAPSISKLFVGLLLGTHGDHSDVFLQAPVPGHDVIDVWQPGHPEYDRHRDLPAS